MTPTEAKRNSTGAIHVYSSPLLPDRCVYLGVQYSLRTTRRSTPFRRWHSEYELLAFHLGTVAKESAIKAAFDPRCPATRPHRIPSTSSFNGKPSGLLRSSPQSTGTGIFLHDSGRRSHSNRASRLTSLLGFITAFRVVARQVVGRLQLDTLRLFPRSSNWTALGAALPVFPPPRLDAEDNESDLHRARRSR